MNRKPFNIISYLDNRRKIIPICLKAQMHKLLYKSNKVMVNIGSGVWTQPYWKNLDFYTSWYGGGLWWKKTIDINYDLTSMKFLPFWDDSVDLFYSEYAFEHIPLSCTRHVFEELFRCLKPYGGFRVIVPDMDIIYQKFKEGDTSIFEHYLRQQNNSLVRAFLVYFSYPDFSFSEEEFMDDFKSLSKEKFLDKYTHNRDQQHSVSGHHISWFNYSKMKHLLESVGFDKVLKSECKGSVFREMHGDGFDTRPGYPGLYVDCIKGDVK